MAGSVQGGASHPHPRTGWRKKRQVTFRGVLLWRKCPAGLAPAPTLPQFYFQPEKQGVPEWGGDTQALQREDGAEWIQ